MGGIGGFWMDFFLLDKGNKILEEVVKIHGLVWDVRKILKCRKLTFFHQNFSAEKIHCFKMPSLKKVGL